MTYPNGGWDRYPPQSASAYGAYWPSLTGAENQRSSWAEKLVWAVLALGLATYVVSCAAEPSGTGLGVRFSTLAAIVAALGLLPRQSVHPKLMSAFALMGFLDALSQSITDDHNPGWATIVVVILIALQTITTIALLLTRQRASSVADPGLNPYQSYAYYAQAAQQYYAAQNQPPPQEPVQAQGTAHAEASAAAQARQSATEQHALYAEYLNTQQPDARRIATSSQAGERTQAPQSAPATWMPTTGPTEHIRPSSDPAAGSPTQSFP